MKYFIVYSNDQKIGYCLYTDGNDLYEDITEENHTFEIGYMISKEDYLNKGIGKIIIKK